MRPYTPKGNVQKKSYYSNRFRTEPHIPRQDVAEDPVFAAQVETLKQEGLTLLEAYVMRGQLVILINASDNVKAVRLFKEKLGYNQLSELSAIDWLEKYGKFEIFYQLLHMQARKRARIKCFIDENEAIESVEPLFRSADWSEREMYDMFGIKVNNHPNLKRILLPEDWHGWPLRKTYPLQGDEFAQWYEIDKIYGPEYRDKVGPEIRDSAWIDKTNTKLFAQVGREVPFGAPYSSEKTPIRYQEENKPFLIDNFSADRTKILPEKK
ncbi:MAG: NADH-quinone oxidoreductase subunit C [Campylobacterales bacterium]